MSATILALSLVQRYMEDQNTQLYNDVYLKMALTESCIRARWIDLLEQREEILADQVELTNHNHFDAALDLDEDIEMALVDATVMQNEVTDIEMVLDGLEDQVYIQRRDAFYLFFAIGRARPDL